MASATNKPSWSTSTRGYLVVQRYSNVSSDWFVSQQRTDLTSETPASPRRRIRGKVVAWRGGWKEVIMADSSWNVGIWTTAPTAKLHVVWNTSVEWRVQVVGDSWTLFLSSEGILGEYDLRSNNGWKIVLFWTSTSSLDLELNDWNLEIKDWDLSVAGHIKLWSNYFRLDDDDKLRQNATLPTSTSDWIRVSRRSEFFSTRVYFYTDNRRILDGHTQYWMSYHNMLIPWWLGAEPVLSRTAMWLFVRKWETVESLTMIARSNSLEISDVDIRVIFMSPDSEVRWETGIDSPAELVFDTKYSWTRKDGNITWDMSDTTKKEINIGFTAPVDWFLNLWVKPVGTITAIRYFYMTYGYTIS